MSDATFVDSAYRRCANRWVHERKREREQREREKRPQVRRWYDRGRRNWVVQKVDAQGNQIGDAVYIYTRAEAVRKERAAYVKLLNELKKAQ